MNIEIDGDMDDCFAMQPARKGAVDPLLHTLEMYPAKQRDCLTVIRPGPDQKNTRIWVHPGEPVFERFRAIVSDRLGDQALRGAVFVDPTTEKPYLFHLALISVVRQADAELPDLASEEVLDCQLVGVKQFEGAQVALCPVEHLLLLKGGQGLPAAAQRLAVTAEKLKDQAEAFMTERVARHVSQPEMPTDVDYIRVMSLHKSKGLTADLVVVCGCLQGLIPSIDTDATPQEQQRAMEEQRRLFYVAGRTHWIASGVEI